MKNIITKSWGVILTLSILITLLVPAMPVSAGNLTWSTIPVLDVDGLQLTKNTSANIYEVAPDGKTIYAYCATGFYTDEDNNTFYLIKSTDGGKSWTYKNLDEESALSYELSEVTHPYNISKIVFSPKFAADDTMAAIGWYYDSSSPEYYYTIFISYDAGNNWEELGQLDTFITETLGETRSDISITDLDIAYNSNEELSFAFAWGNSEYGGVGMYIERSRTRWLNLSNEEYNWIFSEVMAVSFSPNYEDDELLMAVCKRQAPKGTDEGESDTVNLQTIVDGQDWNDDYKIGLMYNAESDSPISSTLVDKAYIAFPADYDAGSSTTNKVFVGLYTDSETSGGVNDIYRIDGATFSTSSQTVKARSLGYYDLGLNSLSDIAFAGDYSNGTLIAADIDGMIFTTGEVSNSKPEWNQAEKPLSGILPKLALNDNGVLYVGTNNYDDGNCWGSVFGYSEDYSIFTGLSLISFEVLSDVVYTGIVDAGTKDKFLGLADGSLGVLMKSEDGGDSWAEVYNNAYDDIDGILSGPVVRVSPDYADDQTVYFVSKDKYIYKSTDGGNTFTASKVYVTDGDIVDFFLIDASNFYVGGTDGIYKNTTKTPVINIDELDDDYAIRSIDDDWFVIVDNVDGDIFLSTDEGSSFDKIVNLGDYSLQVIDKASQTFYATYGGDIYKFVVDESTGWELIGTAVDSDEDEINIKTMYISGEGIVYASANLPQKQLTSSFKLADKVLSIPQKADGYYDTSYPQAYRLISLPGSTGSGNIEFEAIKNSSYDDLGGLLDKGSYCSPIYVLNYDDSYLYQPSTDSIPLPIYGGEKINGVRYTLKSWTDIIGTGPNLVSPFNAEDVYSDLTLVWTDVSKATGYTYQIATNSDFSDAIEPVDDEGDTSFISSTSVYIEGLTNGVTYYWRVKVAEGKPYESPWSETRTFTVKLGKSRENLAFYIAPTAGATGVNLTPTFQWTSISGATKYEIQLADNANFTGAQSGNVTGTVWVPGTDLNYSTTYYWRVRAVSDSTVSDWVTGVFTTMDEPVEEPEATTAAPAQKYFDPVSGLYFDTQADLEKYQAAHADASEVATAGTPAYIWVIIIVGGVLAITVIILIFVTRKS